MCDQTEVSYLPDDVVWVKLSNVWWPAQVQDESKLDEDVTSGLRKKPLAVVKFFDEDLYEFPKNLNQIYHYNCFKKDEFIKKGLDLCRPSGYREVSENMKKFPLDVKKAEIMTGGNPDIINDPKYQPEEKFDYREQFGLKPRKKSSLGSKHNNSDNTMETPKPSRVKFSTPISAPSTSRTPETKISNVSKSFSNPIRRTMAVKRTASGILRNGNVDKENDSKQFSTGRYYCSYCDYSCCRMGVIIEHYRSHYRGWISPLPNQTPQSYSKVFQSNLLKRKEYVSSTPNAGPKHVSEKTSVKRKSVEDSTPIKKRKHESTKKEKVSVSASGSSLSIPTKDMVGSAAVPKKRQRKSKDTKSVTAKELEALDILKDWEDDSDEETEIKLSSPEINETDQAKDASKSVSDSVSENEEQAQPPPQEHKKEVTSKEKCCFDFEDNDESLNLNKSLKFGQKLPRVISEEKPNVQRLLKELKESKEPLLKKEESINEDFNEEIENLLKNTEVPKLPGIPKTSLPKSIEKSVTEDFPKPQKEVTEIKESSEDYGGEPSKEIEIQAEESSSMIESVTSSQTTVQSAIIVEKSTASENDAAVDSASEAIEKKTDEPKSSKEKNVSNFTKNSTSVSNTSVTENITDINRSDTKNSEEKEHLTQEACSTKDILEQDISRNESKSSSNESESQSVMNSETCEADTVLPSTTTESTLNKDTEISLNVTEKEEEISGSFTEEKVTNIVDQLAPMEVEIDSHEEMSTSKANKEQDIVEQNDGLQNIENISISEVNSSNENDEKSLKEVEITDKQNDLGPIPVDDTMKIQVVSSSVKNDVVAKSEPSTSLETPSDQIPFDINSMPIVIDQDPIMEIMEGHVEPLPNADVVRVFIRNSGEEEPEDFQGPKRLLTVSPPPPNLPPIPGVKKIPLPPPKNKNGANSSNKVSGNVTSGSTARYTLNKQPPKNVSQQPKILFIKNTTGGPSKLLIPQQQSSIFAQAGKLQPGTRIITTNPQLVSKGPVQKKVTSKSIVVGKQGFPTTAKVVQKSVIGQVIQKVSQQPIICNKNASTVLVNSPKTIVSRSVGRNVLLSSQQLKTTTAMQVTAGTKVVRAAQVVKTPGTVFQQAEAVLPQKVVQSTSALNDNKKQIIKNKQLSPNILQRTQRKVSRQQVIKKSQLLTIPSSVQQQSREVVTVNNLPIVQSIGSHSSSEPLGMVYYVGNSQYAVENPVIPVENDNQNVYVTSTSSSGNLDNIIFSIDGTTNFVNISNDTATPTSTHVPSQDILAKALANTQVLQSETTDIVDGENTVYVDQQFQAPSLSNTVLETSLTLNQPPIMTPLEVPSSITPQSNVSHIIPITNITKKADIPQPSMPLLTDDVDVPGNTVFLSDSSAIPTTSGHLTFQLVHDNNLVSSGIMQEKSIKLDTDSKEDNVLPEFLKGNFGSKSEVPKKEPSPKRSER